MKRSDLLLAIASLAIAVLLWFQVQPLYEPGREREFAVPLRAINVPDGLTPSAMPDSVMVVAGGSQNNLDRLDASEVVAEVDLRTARAGSSASLVRVRGGGSAVDVRPRNPRVEIRLEPITTVELAVTVDRMGTPPEGVGVQDLLLAPRRVKVVGPQSQVPKVRRARVSVDLTSVTPGMAKSLVVDLLDAEGRPVPMVSADPGSVGVTIVAAPEATTKSVPVSVDWRGRIEPGWRVTGFEVSPPSVVLSGSPERLAALSSLLTVPIDLTGVTGRDQRQVPLNLPGGVTANVPAVQVTFTLTRFRETP